MERSTKSTYYILIIKHKLRESGCEIEFAKKTGPELQTSLPGVQAKKSILLSLRNDFDVQMEKYILDVHEAGGDNPVICKCLHVEFGKYHLPPLFLWGAECLDRVDQSLYFEKTSPPSRNCHEMAAGENHTKYGAGTCPSFLYRPLNFEKKEDLEDFKGKLTL